MKKKKVVNIHAAFLHASNDIKVYIYYYKIIILIFSICLYKILIKLYIQKYK